VYFYQAFGMSFSSEVEINDFFKIKESKSNDVVYKYGHIKLPPDLDQTADLVITSHQEGMLLYWREIGTFLVENGNTVTIKANTSPPRNGLIRSVLIGPALGILMYQRKSHYVYHSSVVSKDDGKGAIAFMAMKGGGKSTMAAAMLKNGYSLVSDDLLALCSDTKLPVVQPGFPGMKLWLDSAEHLGENADDLPALGENVVYDKRMLDFKDDFIDSEDSLNCAVLLEYENIDKPELIRLSKKEALVYLIPHWYGAMFKGQMIPLLGKKRLIDEIAYLTDKVIIYKLIRPRSLEKINSSVDIIDELRDEIYRENVI